MFVLKQIIDRRKEQTSSIFYPEDGDVFCDPLVTTYKST
jgi:hypothetical protein